MSRSAKIILQFGDGDHEFRLRVGELEELQDKTQTGPLETLFRLQSDRWKTADVRETIRLGLIGGGKPALDALKLVSRYVDERPDWLLNAKVAMAVLGAALAGVPEEDAPPKPKGGEGPPPTSPKDGGSSASSTGPAERSGSARSKSPNAASGSSTKRRRVTSKPTARTAASPKRRATKSS